MDKFRQEVVKEDAQGQKQKVVNLDQAGSYGVDKTKKRDTT